MNSALVSRLAEHEEERQMRSGREVLRSLSNTVKKRSEGFGALFHDRDHSVPANERIRRAGDTTGGIHLVVSGWLMRSLVLPDGRRQILGFLLPGDVFGVGARLAGRADCEIETLTPCVLAPFRGDTLPVHEDPKRASILLWVLTRETALLRTWVAVLGRRSADERLAHLLLELATRLDAIDLATSEGFGVPLTQSLLADALGVTTVHINRVIQDMRRTGLITLRGQKVVVHDWDALVALAQFDPAYLDTVVFTDQRR